jgi:flagellar L-ring protein precursor FlgH
MKWNLAVFGAVSGVAIVSATASAQSASLYGIPGDRSALTLSGASWYYQELEPIKEIRINDIVTVIVDEKSQVTSEAEIERRKRSSIDARLQDWIRLTPDLKPAPQADGDPRIRASLNGELRNEMGLETAEGMRFRISARVVDIRPNGNLVLEAHRTISNNNEVWEQSLSGVVRREDVLPNNTVLSEKIAELQVCKREQGHVREGYRRGWLQRIVDKYKPF